MQNKSGFLNFTSLALLGVGAVLLLMAALLTPENFIALGPLRRSLTSANELVRDTALLEVSLFRIACLVLAASAFIGGFFRRQITSSATWRKLEQHEPSALARNQFGTFNISLAIIAALALVGVVFIFYAPNRISIPLTDLIIKEDGVVEYISAVLFFVSFLMGAWYLLRCEMATRHRFMIGSLSFCLFVFCGEEISWGQRIFGVETLEIMQGTNVQNENNLHNMFGYLFPSLFLLAVIVYGVLLPILAACNGMARKLADLAGLPLASTGLALGFLIAVLFRDWSFEKVAGSTPYLKSAEIGEMLISVGFLLLMIEIGRHLARTGAAAK